MTALCMSLRYPRPQIPLKLRVHTPRPRTGSPPDGHHARPGNLAVGGGRRIFGNPLSRHPCNSLSENQDRHDGNREGVIQAPVRPLHDRRGRGPAAAPVDRSGHRNPAGDPAGRPGAGAVPPDTAGARRPDIRLAEVPHDGRRGGEADRSRLGGLARRARHAGGARAAAPAPGRTAAARERGAGRDEPRGAAPRAPGAGRAHRAPGAGLCTAPGRPARDRRDGPGVRLLPPSPGPQAALRHAVHRRHEPVAGHEAVRSVRSADVAGRPSAPPHHPRAPESGPPGQVHGGEHKRQ